MKDYQKEREQMEDMKVMEYLKDKQVILNSHHWFYDWNSKMFFSDISVFHSTLFRLIFYCFRLVKKLMKRKKNKCDWRKKKKLLDYVLNKNAPKTNKLKRFVSYQLVFLIKNLLSVEPFVWVFISLSGS